VVPAGQSWQRPRLPLAAAGGIVACYMLQDWQDIGPHTTVWTADHDEQATQKQDFNENPFSDEHLQIRWAMMAKSQLQEDTTDEGASKATLSVWQYSKPTTGLAKPWDMTRYQPRLL
jgi:hypothetical protein